MGLFSSHKKSEPTTDIPADVLADVSVNGEKQIQSPAPSQIVTQEPNAVPQSTSPFLRPKTATTPEVAPEQPQVVELVAQPVPPVTSPLMKSPTPEAPKAFQFADQTPVSNEIRFTDVPEPEERSPLLTPTPEINKEALKPDFSKITQDQALLARHKEHLAPLKETLSTGAREEKKFLNTTTLLSIGVLVLILIFIAGGSWYYLHTRTNSTPMPAPSIAAIPNTDLPAQASKTEGVISVNQPNYLLIDIETVTLEQIKGLLEEESKKIEAAGITTAVEYLVVDKNNNPVAFSRFALLVGADNPKYLMEASLEPFSLYLYRDSGSLRMALAIALKQEFSASLPVDRSVLPESLKKLFYPEQFHSMSFNGVVFKESSYQNNKIFYTNVDEATNHSFDITLEEGTLTLANSKNTLRAVIDKRMVPSQQ